MPRSTFSSARGRLLLVVGVALLAGACAQAFQPAKFHTNDDLYRASFDRLQHHQWGDAVAGFDRLTLQLPARDSLMPLSMYYLGRAHEGAAEYLLAAQAYNRMAEAFPADTLAPDAMYRAGVSYAKLWRKPTLDATYGQLAIATFQTMRGRYPTSPLAAQAQEQIVRLDRWLARKMYENGMFYLRRKAPYSAIIYFQDVVRQYPATPEAKDALLRLVEVYQTVRYREDEKDACTTLRQRYPSDGDVLQACGPAPATAAAPTPTP
ncbi:MAG TPA: outer membrane protein assembly factor BamD [Gemmatimonadaceae bacterium]|nr:outer membrane protein assembly factor BamD [Gemmatimonadaceae bacterium]